MEAEMIEKIMNVFALSRKGAVGLIKATIVSFFVNISLMFPMWASMLCIMKLLEGIETGNSVRDQIIPMTLIALIIIIALYIIHYIQYPTLYINTYEESAERRVRMAEHLRKLPLSFFAHRDLSDITNALVNDSADLDQMFSHYIPQMFATILSTIVIAVMMFLVDARMAAAIFWVVPLASLFPILSKVIQDRAGTSLINAKLKVADHVQQSLETIKEIKAFNLSDKDSASFRKDAKEQVRCEIKSELIAGIFVASGFIVLKLGFATSIIFGINFVLEGSLSLLYFIGFMLATAVIYNPLEHMLQNIVACFNAKLKINRVKAILDAPIETGSTEFTPKDHTIVFDHVSFSYEKEKGVLDDISFTAKQGAVTALVGPSGGGKSTACRLALRFWDPDKGKITVGGVDISRVDPETLLTHYSIVFQDVTLFNDTILENIRLGRRGASDEDVYKAAKAARCDEFVLKLKDGYDTLLSENGSSLSGGERQRISIARALLKDAPIIFLDEATASLDVENESVIQQAIGELTKGKTVIVIAHRLRTVMNADRICLLEGGCIKEEGSGEELMRLNGRFQHMAMLQSQSQKWKINN